MTDDVTYILPDESEVLVESSMVPRAGEVVFLGSEKYCVSGVRYLIKTAFNGQVKGTAAVVKLDEAVRQIKGEGA